VRLTLEERLGEAERGEEGELLRLQAAGRPTGVAGRGGEPEGAERVYWARIGRIYFANTTADAAEIEFDDRFIYRELQKDPAQRSVPMTQLMREEALQAFRDWRDSTGKVRY
jgi:hypothetical protein